MKVCNLGNEWTVLQNQFDSYEKYSLLIKLVNIALVSAAYLSNNISVFIILLLLILWGQDAIWKTFQSRIETRLLNIEKYIVSGSQDQAYQFNSQYQINSLTGIALINEYLRQAIRPTIAFPHVLLLLIISVELILPRFAQ